MKYETAGDPITGLKWTRKTTAKIAAQLKSLGIQVSANTVAKLLKDMGFSLRVNHKKISSGGKKLTKKARRKRDEQFCFIGDQREFFSRKGIPIISVDTKKKEQ